MVRAMKSPVSNQSGIAFLVPIIWILIICGAAAGWFGMVNDFGLFKSNDHKTEQARQDGQTERTRIDANAFNRNFILLLSTGRELVIILLMAVCACVGAVSCLGLILAFLSHRETVIGMQIRIDHPRQPESINYLNDSHVIDYNPNV